MHVHLSGPLHVEKGYYGWAVSVHGVLLHCDQPVALRFPDGTIVTPCFFRWVGRHTVIGDDKLQFDTGTEYTPVFEAELHGTKVQIVATSDLRVDVVIIL